MNNGTYEEFHCSCDDKKCKKRIRLYKNSDDEFEISVSNANGIFPMNSAVLIKGSTLSFFKEVFGEQKNEQIKTKNPTAKED